MKRSPYRVIGGGSGWAVVEKSGAIVYDLLESRAEARAIRDVLNDGIGPEWDAVSAELLRRKEGVKL